MCLQLGYSLARGSSFFPLCLRPHPLPLLPTLAIPQGFSDLLYLLSISNLTLAPSSRQPSLTAPKSSFPVFFLFTKHQSWVLFVASERVWGVIGVGPGVRISGHTAYLSYEEKTNVDRAVALNRATWLPSQRPASEAASPALPALSPPVCP